MPCATVSRFCAKRPPPHPALVRSRQLAPRAAGPAGPYGRARTYSPAVRGCPNCFPICLPNASRPRARRRSSLGHRPATRASLRRPCRCGSTSAIRAGPTVFPIWKTAASKSHSTSTARPSTRTPPTASHPPIRSPPRAISSANACPRNSLAAARDFLGQRLPALRHAPLVEARVCQYENTSNGDFLIDRHPDFANVWLVGGGSGHGFKHGPAVGEYVAARILHGGPVDPRYSLASKAETQNRTVF